MKTSATSKLAVGQELELAIEGLADDGAGMVGVGDRVLNVAGGTPGDRLFVRVEHLSPHGPVAWARLLEVRFRGRDFLLPRCAHSWPVRGDCGGCPLMHLRPGLQDELKLRRVSRALSSTACGFVPASRRLGYRNRSHFVASRAPDRRVMLGSYRPRSHRVAPMRGCFVVRDPIRKIHGELEDIFSNLDVPVHPLPGGLRYVTVRSSQKGETLVELITGAGPGVRLERAAEEIAKLPDVVGVTTSVNETKGNAIRESPSRLLAGRRTVVEQYGAVEIELDSSAFSQLNTEEASVMYEAAADALEGVTTLWDLYCGAGAIGLTAALRPGGPRCLLGAENTKGAVESARVAAAKLGVEARYEVVDLSRRTPSNWPEPDAVVVNPPRRGLDAPVLEVLKQLSAHRLVYMSCNPLSFARDVEQLVGYGFEIQTVTAYDMLPQTTHVELLAVLVR